MYHVLVGRCLSRVRWTKRVQAVLSFYPRWCGKFMKGNLNFQSDIAASIQTQWQTIFHNDSINCNISKYSSRNTHITILALISQ